MSNFDALDDIIVDVPQIPEEEKPKPILKPVPVKDLEPKATTEPMDVKRELSLIDEPEKLFDFSHTSLSPLQQMYIIAYVTKGTKTSACKVAGVSLTTVYKWLEKNKEFRDALQAAVDTIADVLEQEALKRALHGSDKMLIKMLQAYRPEKFADKRTTDVRHSGQVVHSWADLASEATKEIEAEYSVEED